MLRVGRIPYLNCEPFFAHLRGCELVPLAPRALGQAVARGALDAGPLSLADCLELAPRLATLPLGIATSSAARSVLLFSHRPLRELGGAVIGVTSETSTSIQILRILLALRHEVEPAAWVGADAPADALLLIGDPALRMLKSGRPFAHVVDLGTEWTEWTGLPCVFARWAVSRTLPEAERVSFGRRLEWALERGLADVRTLALGRPDTALGPDEAAAYLRGFTYRLGSEEEKAIAEFARLRSLVED